MVQLSFNPLHALNPSSQQGLSHIAKICASLGFKAQIRWMALCPCNSAVLLLSLKPCFIHLQISSWFISSQITIISIDSSNSLPKPCLFPRHFYLYKSISYYRVCWKAYNSDYLFYTQQHVYIDPNLPTFLPHPPWHPYICSLCSYLCFCFANINRL